MSYLRTPQVSFPSVTLSLISHGQGKVLTALLRDIEAGMDTPYRLILTFNIPESEAFLSHFPNMPITVIRNQRPLGFGQNHNQAFACCTDAAFAIINPDIRGTPFALKPLLVALETADVGACGPHIVSSVGILQDSARSFPTLTGLLARKLGFTQPDYPSSQGIQTVDWLAGMLIVFKSKAYRAVGGFDDAYFMYVEDVDIGWRLSKAGYRSTWVPDCQFEHDAQHGSRKKIQHTLWHVQSMFRFLLKRVSSVRY